MFKIIGLIVGIIAGLLLFFLSRGNGMPGISLGIAVFMFAICLIAGIILDKIASFVFKTVIIVVIIVLFLGGVSYLSKVYEQPGFDELYPEFEWANSSDPITLQFDKVVDGKLMYLIGFYCDSPTICENAKPHLECEKFDAMAVNTNVEPHTAIGYVMYINTTNSPGTYPCKVFVDNTEEPGQPWRQEKEFEIVVE